MFNLFNVINPNFPIGAASSVRIFTGTKANPILNAVFMKPTSYAGDAGRPEQRVGQLGLRFTF